MDRRIQTRVVDIVVDKKTATLIQKDACMIWWLAVSSEENHPLGEIKIYDGFDAGGKLVYEFHSAYGRTENFIPPIPCDYGIYITSDSYLAYTIGFRPRSWPREMP